VLERALDGRRELRFEPRIGRGPRVVGIRQRDGLAEFWSQDVVGRANGNLLKVAKGIGSTTWHSHDDQDEVFLVTSGKLVVQLRTGDVTLGVGLRAVLDAARDDEQLSRAEE